MYEQFGIVSYWIVDPDPAKPQLTVFELRDGRYQQVAQVAGEETFRAWAAVPGHGHSVRAGAGRPLSPCRATRPERTWGFDDAAHFSKIFKAAYGAPPGRYRQRSAARFHAPGGSGGATGSGSATRDACR